MRLGYLATGVAVAVLGGVAVTGAWASGPVQAEDPPVSQVEIEVTGGGFVPGDVEVVAVAGSPLKLVFTRTTGSGCGAEVHIPALGVGKTALPQGEPVTVTLEAPEPGTYEFMCGMNMLRGTLRITAPGGA